jgi:hypothetical protein
MTPRMVDVGTDPMPAPEPVIWEQAQVEAAPPSYGFDAWLTAPHAPTKSVMDRYYRALHVGQIVDSKIARTGKLLVTFDNGISNQNVQTATLKLNQAKVNFETLMAELFELEDALESKRVPSLKRQNAFLEEDEGERRVRSR